ncbi:MAG: Fic family protein [Defluviitaleaceae bacterium]|nr:Fic family protein [Defluviitaleaceae bacterium]MCL2835280.1 Fic family protein [Defluviitaleaceae bacterium]
MIDYSKLNELKARLAVLRPLNAGELKRLRNEFNIEFTYDTNAIEGSTLTLRETALILQEDITIGEKPLRMHLDAIGHRDAFEYVVKISDTADPLTERRIKEIHTLVLMSDAENRGIYRSVPVMIQGALHTPPQPYLIAPQMEALLAEYEDMKRGRHIIEAIAEFHLRFEGIHPFIDGNGRTGRLIINLELIKAGFLPVNIKFTDRRKYYDCFDSYYGNEPHKPDALAELIAGYEVGELERYIKIIENKNGSL